MLLLLARPPLHRLPCLLLRPLLRRLLRRLPC
jgi:hypothetical protein